MYLSLFPDDFDQDKFVGQGTAKHLILYPALSIYDSSVFKQGVHCSLLKIIDVILAHYLLCS